MFTQFLVGWQGCIQPFPTLRRKEFRDWCWYRVLLVLLCVLGEELLPGRHPFSPVLDSCQGEGGREGCIFIFCSTSWPNLAPEHYPSHITTLQHRYEAKSLCGPFSSGSPSWQVLFEPFQYIPSWFVQS